MYISHDWGHHDRMRVAGVAVEGGRVYLAAATRTDDDAVLLSPSTAGSCRIESNAGLGEAARLVDLSHRVEQRLRALDVSHVALVATRKLVGLKYADAWTRITCVCAVMAACVQCEVEFGEIKTSTIGKHIGVDPKILEQADHSKFGLPNLPQYWTAGIAKAYGAAAVLLAGQAGS